MADPSEKDMHEIEPLWFTFDGPPGPVAGRFVEVENERGQSRTAGKWADNGGGYWTCGPFITVDDHKKALAYERAAAREEGRREGLERAALLPRKWKHIENVRQQIGNHVTEVSASDVAWIATVIEADIRALITKEP